MIGTIGGEVELLYPNGTQNVVNVHRDKGLSALNCVELCRRQLWVLWAGSDGMLAMLSFGQLVGKSARSYRMNTDRNMPPPAEPLMNVCFSETGEIGAIAAGYD
jgi:hypothetical protein